VKRSVSWTPYAPSGSNRNKRLRRRRRRMLQYGSASKKRKKENQFKQTNIQGREWVGSWDFCDGALIYLSVTELKSIAFSTVRLGCHTIYAAIYIPCYPDMNITVSR
jgi:hypothetical protein